MAIKETTDHSCPACDHKVDRTPQIEDLSDLRGWDRAGVLFMFCPHCGTLIRIQEEDVRRGENTWSNYYITIAGAID